MKSKVITEKRSDCISLSNGKFTLKLPLNAYVPWHVDWFDYIFETFQDKDGMIDISSPALVKIRKTGEEFFVIQAPEDIGMEGYLKINPPNKNSVVFDVGANVGFTVCRYAKMCKRVIAFEPNSSSFKALSRNVELHDLRNVLLVLAGIWSETKDSEITTNLGGGDALKEYAGRHKTEKVRVFNLEDAIKMTRKPTHIKMDIERAELDVIAGNLDYIAQNDFKFAIACYHVVAGDTTANRLVKMFNSIGYKTELVYPEHLTLHAWR